MPFKPVASPSDTPSDPLRMFDDSPRMPGAIPELWRQQADVLREYSRDFVTESDVAFDLPTGTGKTIVGLLVAGWRRAKFDRPVVYACPTRQLAHQVSSVAEREGIPAVRLIGSHKGWEPADQARYESAQAIGITTYNAVFNVRPRLGSPGTVLFDDAHAAEQFVAEAWTVSVERRDEADYLAVLDALRSGLDGMFVERLRAAMPDVATRRDVRLVVPARRPALCEALDRSLQALTDGSGAWWRAQMVRSGLESCLVYVSWGRIQIRPFVPPTSVCEPFHDADQRVYLSATLGRAGELSRAFGRPTIKRVPLPGDDDRAPRSGRRFFVFPDFVEGDSDSVSSSAASSARKVCVLAKSTNDAHDLAMKLNEKSWPLLTKDDVAAGVEPFAKLTEGFLALAGRYDGIDLPGDACRMVVLDGTPDIPHHQEQFLSSNLRARGALDERTRTRIVQGAGRATRSPSDHAIVLVHGVDLARYLSDPAVRKALEPELQAEIAFGHQNSVGVSADDLRDNIRIFLEQGAEWRDGAEPMIGAARRDMHRVPIEGEQNMAAAAAYEVDACARAWRGDWVGARDAAIQAGRELAGVERLRNYRSLWLYLGAVWSFKATAQDANANSTGTGLLNDAHLAAKGTTWLRETDPGDVPSEQLADDSPAVRRVAAMLSGKSPKVVDMFARISEGLASVEHSKSEPALTELGTMLGAEAFKPQGRSRADSAWCWDERLWIAIEAKTEQSPEQALPMRDVRQANTQLRLLADDRAVPIPEMSVDVIVSPRTKIDPEAVAGADPEIHLVHPDILRELAVDAHGAWRELQIAAKGHKGRDLEELVRRVMGERRCLPTQIRQRLTETPIRS